MGICHPVVRLRNITEIIIYTICILIKVKSSYSSDDNSFF